MRVQRLTVKPASKEQPTPLAMVIGHSDLGLVLWPCLESLLQSSWIFNNQPLRSSALPQCTASIPMWVVRGFLPLHYLAIFCLNEFMPWINIVCELNCLLGKQEETNRILRNLVWNQFLEWGCMCLGLWNWTPKEAPLFSISPMPLSNWDTPSATRTLPLLWKMTVPTTGWWGKRMYGGGCTEPGVQHRSAPWEQTLRPWWARGTCEALSENVWNQQMNGKYTHLLFFTDSMLLIIFSTCWNLFVTSKSTQRFLSHCKHAQSSENVESPSAHVPSWGQTRCRSAFLSQLSYVNKYAVLQSTWCHVSFSYFCTLCWLFCYFKWPYAV